MFIVEIRTYIPTAKNITIGILVKTLEGSKNQNKPTLNVNSIGKISETQVIFLPRPSINDQADSKPVKIINKNIAGNRDTPFNNWIKTKPIERTADVMA